MEILLLAIGIGLILYAIYKWGTLTYNYWELRNVKFLKPSFIFGNTGDFMRGKYTMMEFAEHLYNAFPKEKVYGIFDFRQPMLVIRDPDVLKKLTVKDFDHFENHRTFLDERSDTLFGNSLFLMRSEKWRDMRANLSPAFTSSKMRQMYDLVGDTAYEMVEFFKQKTNNGQEVHAEMKDLFSKYTNDVIATAAFGIKVNSFENEKNEFFTSGKTILDFSGYKTLAKVMLLRIAPIVSHVLGIQFLDATASKFFKTMVLDTMKLRKERNIFRPDMINMLMQLKEGRSTAINAASHLSSAAAATEEVEQEDGFATVEESNVGKAKVTRKWNDDELIAQCFLFFVAGFDTSSTALMFAVYELMRNPDIQQRLYEEVAETDRRLGGKRLPYDELQRMQYMDQVFSESLRMWPPAPFVDRECVKDYEYDDGENRFTITKGAGLWVLIHSLHHDPQYFPEPSKFDPDRFSDENKHNIQAGTYVPFGSGPRNCIGSRFALMEVKAVMYYLLLNFKFVPNAETQIPLKLAKHPASIKTERGLHIQLMPRA